MYNYKYEMGKRLVGDSVENFHVHARDTVPNIIFDNSGLRCDMHERLRNYLAQHITTSKVREERETYHTTLSVDCYVFSPDEFWEIVQREASRYAFQSSPVLDLKKENSGVEILKALLEDIESFRDRNISDVVYNGVYNTISLHIQGKISLLQGGTNGN